MNEVEEHPVDIRYERKQKKNELIDTHTLTHSGQG